MKKKPYMKRLLQVFKSHLANQTYQIAWHAHLKELYDYKCPDTCWRCKMKSRAPSFREWQEGQGI